MDPLILKMIESNLHVDSRNRDNWRLKFGLISPTVCDFSKEFHRMSPDGVEFCVVTTEVREINREDLSKSREQRYQAARLLDEWEADCIIAAGGPVSTLEGVTAERELIDDLQSELEAEFSTMVESQISGFRELDAESLIVVTPFTEKRDQETKEYLENSGFDVIAIGGPRLSKVNSMSNSDTNAAYRSAVTLANQVDEEFDATYIPCIPWGSVESIEAIEEDTGRPVVMSAQAQLWNGLSMAGLNPEIKGYGQLMETLMNK